MKQVGEDHRIVGYVGKADIIRNRDIAEVNWSSIGAVSVVDAEEFALKILKVCAAVRHEAGLLGIEIAKSEGNQCER